MPQNHPALQSDSEKSALEEHSHSSVAQDGGKLKDLNTPVSNPLLKGFRSKLSGAAQKRYRWLLKRGMAPQEAALKAKDPMHKTGYKRIRFEDLTEESIKPDPKKSKSPPPQDASHSKEPKALMSTYQQIAGSVRVGVIPAELPEAKFSRKQMTLLENEILRHILNQRDSSLKPGFLGISHKPEWLVITCCDNATAQWLKSKQEHLNPWKDATIKVVEEKDIPRTKVLVGLFPNSAEDNNEKILDYLQSQNAGFIVGDWKVLRRQPMGKSTHLTLSADHHCADKLKASNYKVFYKFGRIQLRPRGGFLKEAKLASKILGAIKKLDWGS